VNDSGSSQDQRLAALYLHLIESTAVRGPSSTRAILLLLAGHHATLSGWQFEADACRRLLLEEAPHHLIRRHSSFGDAQSADDFSALLRQCRRHCPPERAEHLASLQGVDLEALRTEPPRLLARNVLDRLA